MIHIKKGDVDFYKILAGWLGGYLYGDSWRINSSCTSVTRDGNTLEFAGASGNVYRVHEHAYGTSMLTAGILKKLEDEAALASIEFEILSAETDWEAIEL